MKVDFKESETVEFKTSFQKEVIISLTSFANTKGGTVYIGVDDNGEVPNGILATLQYKHQKISTEITEQVKRLIFILKGSMSRVDIMSVLQLKHRPSFIYNYLTPAISMDLIAMEFPDNPNHKNQRYYLTEKGKRLKTTLAKN